MQHSGVITGLGISWWRRYQAPNDVTCDVLIFRYIQYMQRLPPAYNLALDWCYSISSLSSNINGKLEKRINKLFQSKKHWNNLDTWLHFPETSCASKCWASRPDKLHGGIPESFSLSISSFQSFRLQICFPFIYGAGSHGSQSLSCHSSICFTGLMWWLTC